MSAEASEDVGRLFGEYHAADLDSLVAPDESEKP